MQTVDHEKLIDLVSPEFEQGRFGKIRFDGLFVFGGKSDPYSLCLHGHDVMVDDPLFYQPIDICSVGGDKRGEFIIHVKLYGHLEFSHVAYLIINNTSAV